MLLDRPYSIVDWFLLLGALLATGVTLWRQLADFQRPPAGHAERKPANPTRKVVHMCLGVLVVCLWLPARLQFVVPLIWLLGFFIGWLLFSQKCFAVLAWGSAREATTGVVDTGIIAYPTVMLWSSLLHPPIATALLLTYLAIGDGLASLVGAGARAVTPLPWNPAKSWRGLVAFIVGSGVVASLLMTAYAATLGAEQLLPVHMTPILTALGLGTLLAIVESLRGPIDDNLRIGLFFALAWSLIGFA